MPNLMKVSFLLLVMVNTSLLGTMAMAENLFLDNQLANHVKDNPQLIAPFDLRSCP